MIEIWKDIPGYEGKYQVSNTGRVKSLIFKNRQATFYREKILTPQLNNKYFQVTLCKENKCKIINVHRLVALTFINNPNNYPCVNHIDGNKLNNCISNLEWCTYSYNIQHSYQNNLQKVIKGNNHHAYGKPSKKRKIVYQLNDDNDIIKVWNCARDIEEKLGFNSNNIRACCRKERLHVGGFKWSY